MPAPFRDASYVTGAPLRPPLSASLEGERKFVREPGLLALRGAGLRTASLGNTTEPTRGAPPTLGRDGRLKSMICTGIKKQRLCASWLGGSEVQQGKHDFVQWACLLSSRDWLVISAFYHF